MATTTFQETDGRRTDLKIGSPEWSSLTDEEIDSILKARIAAYEAPIEARGGKRPKREGYVLERIATIENLRDADAKAQDGKVKVNRYIRRHNNHAEKDLRNLQRMILTLGFPPPKWKSDKIKTDAGKVREIVKRNYFPWRILEHAIMNIVMPIILKHLIIDTVACIKGKGLHFGVKRLKKMMRLHPELKWFWKCDYKKYYQSVPHDEIEGTLRERIKDENFSLMLRLALFSYSTGEDIEIILEDEERNKERHANWLIHKSAVRRVHGKRHRPRDERGASCKVLSEVL